MSRPMPFSIVDGPKRPEDVALLDAAQVAVILGVRLKRVYELGIPHVRLSSRTLRWRRADVLEWIEGRRSS